MCQNNNYNTLFYRNLEKYIEDWKNRSQRKPLIIRGARQVGKTTLVKKVSRTFDHFIQLNLEKKEDRKYFENQDNVSLIVDLIIIDRKIKISEGEYILFFIDEIQQMPECIGLLRYFYEELPKIHVIAAGSLLEFVLGDITAMPVGRVEQVLLHPLSFDEFLKAIGQDVLFEKWDSLNFDSNYHQMFLKYFRSYMAVGGLPEAIKTYVDDNESMKGLNLIYENIWFNYLEDINKYGKNNSEKKVLNYVIENAPYVLDRFSFNSFGQSMYKGKEISESFRKLQQARILQLIYPTTSLKVPIMVDLKKRPRIQFLDTGLLLYVNNKAVDLILNEDMNDQFRGAIYNHVCLQEVMSHSYSLIEKYMFWVKESKDSNAEVDLVINHNNRIIPIEVKAGPTGRLRSLFEFMDRVDHNLAVRINTNKYSVEHIKTINGKPFTLINIPVYAAGKVRSIIENFKDYT